MFITDFEEIMDILDTSQSVFLYDTAAISVHELAFFRYGYQLPNEFIQGHPIIISQTIVDELRLNEDADLRYVHFFSQFNKLILIDETMFVQYFHEMYSPKQHALSKYQSCAIRSFLTIQSLAEAIKYTPIHQVETRINVLFNTYFYSGRNKGEYSLLWLSNLIRDVFPTLDINFIGLDRDLYRIVDHCYYRFDNISLEIRNRVKVRIISNDLMLQARVRKGLPIAELVSSYRDPARKLLYREINNGITEHTIIEGAMDNSLFMELLELRQIEIVY
ncbi:hypothetical protein QNH46_23540 [Paenibacillus woosongensis]|uniref:Uncharacterized protein n=1 Tax=Paenibacillus woosongensis TaxID=307580 RepID=A0AA95L0X9_9BACL|nr:hypothetical protein [Paenibacillus woosongensis]WHX48984.1 hypothetical protein QNH46_23540 [Paenibacillus woosongensis]